MFAGLRARRRVASAVDMFAGPRANRAGDHPADELDRSLDEETYLIIYTLRGEDRDHAPVVRLIKHIAGDDNDVVKIDGSIWAIRTQRTSNEIQGNLLGHGIGEGDLLFVSPLPSGNDWNLIGAKGEGRDAHARETLDSWLRRAS